VGHLPIAYLLATVTTGLVVLFHSKIQLRISLRALIIASLVLFGVTGFFLQWVLQTDFGRRSAFLSYFYWVWASVLIVALITHFWMTINELLNPREAKRLLAFLNSGGILGAVLGGLLVGFLSEGALGVWLLPLACTMLFAGVFVVGAIFGHHRDRPPEVGQQPTGKADPAGPRPGFRDSFDSVRKHRFLTLIAGIVATGVIVSICTEFQFLSAADATYLGRPRAMQAFFGFFDPALTIFAFFLNFLMAGWFIKKLGIARSLLLTPAVLLVCSLAILLTPFGLVTGILIRGSDESLNFSLNHPVREILYIPIAAQLRHKAKPFIDMFVFQSAKVAGALILLVFALVLEKEIEGLTPIFNPGLAKGLSWVVIAFLVPWTLFGVKIGREYLGTLMANIRLRWRRAEQDLKETFDLESAKLVFDTIDSRNTSSVLYFLHLFDLLAQPKLSPDVKKLVTEKAWEVRATALNDRFEAEGAGGFPETSGETLPEGILAEIPIIMSSAEYQQLMMPYLKNVLAEGRGSEIKKMELAKAMGLMKPDSPLADWLTRLIDDDSPGVACLALKSAARLTKESYIPAIIRKLDNFITLEDAVSALQKYGDTAIGALEEILHDGARETPLRMAVVEVLARDATRQAVQALTEELGHGDGKLDEGIIDALDRIRSENADIPLSVSTAKWKTFSLIKKYCQTYIDIQHQNPGEKRAGLQRRYLESYFTDIFKLLGLYYPQKDIRTAYQNIKAGTRNAFAHAAEWLDNALKKDLKDALLPIIEDLDPEEKTKRFQKILKDLSGL
jgi:AAA family ATP:ADP antiporter